MVARLNIVHALGGSNLTPDEVKTRSKLLREKIAFMKVHPAFVIRLMCQFNGFNLIDQLKQDGHGVMMDNKGYDIGTEIAEFVQSYEAIGMDILTIHASGGPVMLKKAMAAVTLGSQLRIFGVTLLTSIEDWEVPEIYVTKPRETLLRLMHQVETAKCHGSVCAPRDLNWMREDGIPQDARTRLCPGIRDSNKPVSGDDQNLNRSMTPYEAGQQRVDLMVIGRQLSQAADPAGEADQIQEQFLAGKEAA